MGANRAVVFFPYNPWPFAAGNQKRVREIVLSLVRAGMEIYFVSLDFFEQRWNDEGKQALEKLGVREVLIYPMSGPERKWQQWVLDHFYRPELSRRIFQLNPVFFKM